MPQKFLKLVGNMFLMLVLMLSYVFGCFDWTEVENSSTSSDV